MTGDDQDRAAWRRWVAVVCPALAVLLEVADDAAPDPGAVVAKVARHM